MEEFKLTKLSHFECIDGALVMVGGMSPILAANEVVVQLGKGLGCEFTMTQLYRINFKDKEICTTWQHTDISPVSADILVIELNHEWICVFASFGAKYLHITVDFMDGSSVEPTPEYLIFDWIKSASNDTLRAICKMAGDRIIESKEEFIKLKMEYLKSLKK